MKVHREKVCSCNLSLSSKKGILLWDQEKDLDRITLNSRVIVISLLSRYCYFALQQFFLQVLSYCQVSQISISGVTIGIIAYWFQRNSSFRASIVTTTDIIATNFSATWYQSANCYNNWYRSKTLTKGDMSKIENSTTKFKVDKFNGKRNFDLWQKMVKTLLVQHGLHKTL